MGKQKLYDLSFLNKVSNGDMSFIKEMISTFRQVAPEYISKSKDMFAGNLIEQLSRETHRFIPGVSFLGAKTLEEDLMKLEDNTKLLKNMEEIPALLDSVHGKIERLLQEFDEDFQE